MSVRRTAEEAKQHNIEVMGDKLGSLYHALWNELAWLYSKWGCYVELFGKKPSRIELMNRSAGHFFWIVQSVLWEDSLLHIARLTDSPKSAGRENLTIRQIPCLIEEETLKARVLELIDLAIVDAEFCRDWRNRHIAHKDRGLALSLSSEPLKPASRAKVKKALGSISDVLDALSNHYMETTTSFEGAGGSPHVASLLYFLDLGFRAEQERRERLEAGNYRAEDYQTRDL